MPTVENQLAAKLAQLIDGRLGILLEHAILELIDFPGGLIENDFDPKGDSDNQFGQHTPRRVQGFLRVAKRVPETVERENTTPMNSEDPLSRHQNPDTHDRVFGVFVPGARGIAERQEETLRSRNSTISILLGQK